LQDGLFLVLLLLIIALNVANWSGLRRMNQDSNMARWLMFAELIRLVANTLAIALPFAAFLYGVNIAFPIWFAPFVEQLPMHTRATMLSQPFNRSTAISGTS
jgi:predicted permease